MIEKSAPVAVLISEDLFFGMKVRATAQHAKVKLVWISESQQLNTIEPSNSTEEIPQLILIDLTSRMEWQDIYQQYRSDRVHTTVEWIAFAPHVEADKFEIANKLGITNALPRSKFSKNIASIFAELNKKEAP